MEIETKKLFSKAVFFVLSSAMGLVFLYSGYTKLEPIEPFEYTFVDLGVASWKLAPVIARLMIGLEFLIGFLLIFGLHVKRTIWLTSATLVMFCIYLLVILAKEGNNGNCGCFGSALAMTPVQALIKNAVMLLICFFLFRFYSGFDYGKAGKWLASLSIISAFALPHILNYIDLSYSEAYLTKKEDQFTLELDTLYNNAERNVPPRSLSQGKHLLAFMSASCPHCRIAAKKIRIMTEKNPDLPVYFVLNGEDEKLKEFFEDTQTQNIPYCLLRARPFIYLAGVNLPTLYLVNNSTVEHWVNYMELDQAEIEKWLKE